MHKGHILIILIPMIFGFSNSNKVELHLKTQERYEAAFKKIEKLGGTSLWEAEIVVVDLSNTEIKNNDLSLFKDFPIVQSLILDNTKIDDSGLSYLNTLHHLEHLSIIGTQVTEKGVNKLRQSLTGLEIVTEPLSKAAINPFTGKTFEINLPKELKSNQVLREEEHNNRL